MKNINIPELPKTFKKYLENGTCEKSKYYTKNGFLNKSRLEYTIIYNLVVRQYSKDVIKEVFKNGSKKLHFYKDEKWFEKAYLEAVVYYKTHKENESIDEILDYVLEQYHYLPIPTGVRNTLGEILKMCKDFKTDKLTISASYIAQKRKVTYQTACQHLILLRKGDFKSQKINFPYLEIKEKFVPKRKSYVYKVKIKEIYQMLRAGERKGRIDTHKNNLETSNLSDEEKKKLKATGVSIYEYIISHPNRTIQEIEKSLSICRQTVSKKLDTLEAMKYINKYKIPNPSGQGRPTFVYFT